jgi:hypothetical protein
VWFTRKKKGRVPGEHVVSGMPTGTEIIHNPAPGELEVEVGFSKESELLERHGGRIHLIDGHDRIAIELGCLVEHREHGRPELVEDHTVYVLPEGTSLFEARRIGYHLLEKIGQEPRSRADDTSSAL